MSIWCGGLNDDSKVVAAQIEKDGAEAFGKKYKHMRADLYAAWKRIHPKPLSSGQTSIYPDGTDRLLDAIYLWMNRDNIPFSMYLTADEKCDFLCRPPEKVLAHA